MPVDGLIASTYFWSLCEDKWISVAIWVGVATALGNLYSLVRLGTGPDARTGEKLLV